MMGRCPFARPATPTEWDLAEGAVDLAIREEEPNGPAWTVVDFKTDREIGMRQPEYERQIGLYAWAITKASGEPSNPCCW